jgi:hypothetical protein
MLSVDDDQQLDDLLDDTFGSDDESAADEDELASEAADDEESDADAADDEANDEEEEAEGDDEAEPDEADQLRARLETLEAERAKEKAQQESYARQWQAAQEEQAWVNRWQEAQGIFERKLADAYEASKTAYNPLDAYAIEAQKILQEKTNWEVDYHVRWNGRLQGAYARSQIPAYADFVAKEAGLDPADAAYLLQAVTDQTDPVHPDALPKLASILKQRAQAASHERKAAKQAQLKTSRVRPGGGGAHTPQPKTIDDYIDRIYG